MRLLADNQVNAAAPVRLRDAVIEAMDGDGIGHAAAFGPLTVSNRDAYSVVRLGLAGPEGDPGGAIVRFADSSARGWNGQLRIENWSGDPVFGGGFDQVYFGTSSAGLTAAQLAAITFYDNDGNFLGVARILPTGEIVPVGGVRITRVSRPSATTARIEGGAVPFGQPARVEWTPDLIQPFAFLGLTTAADANGNVQFLDTFPAGTPQRFYRFRYP